MGWFPIQKTFRIQSRSAQIRLLVDRSVDRLKPRSTMPNRELGNVSRSTGRSTVLLLRSTGLVDRYNLCTLVHDGRPVRSTVVHKRARGVAIDRRRRAVDRPVDRLTLPNFRLGTVDRHGRLVLGSVDRQTVRTVLRNLLN